MLYTSDQRIYDRQGSVKFVACCLFLRPFSHFSSPFSKDRDVYFLCAMSTLIKCHSFSHWNVRR